jgi:DNA-binding NarL/FixJ family response regulator
MTPATLDVVVIDDHRVFTDLLALAIDGQPDLRCVAVANTVQDGLAKAAVYPFDVAVVDLQLPDGGGLSVIARLREIRPTARIVVLTGYPRADLMRQSLERGADAFLAKDGALPQILAGIRGGPAADRLPASGDEPAIDLTPREHEVLACMAGGLDARLIAHELGLSLHTVRDYIKALLAKLDAHSQLDAVVTADRLGLVSVGERFR